MGQHLKLIVLLFLVTPAFSAVASSVTPEVPSCASRMPTGEIISIESNNLNPRAIACPTPIAIERVSQANHVVRASELQAQLMDLKLTSQEIHALVLMAKTPADHQRLASYYDLRAESDLAQAMHQQQIALNYSTSTVASSSKFVAGTIDHCVAIVHRLKQHAAKMRKLQKEQEQLALQAGE